MNQIYSILYDELQEKKPNTEIISKVILTALMHKQQQYNQFKKLCLLRM